MGSWANLRSKSQILQVMFPGVNQSEPETDHSLSSNLFIVSLMALEVNQTV